VSTWVGVTWTDDTIGAVVPVRARPITVTEPMLFGKGRFNTGS
jgi:hypothetical protein